jgi:transposase
MYTKRTEASFSGQPIYVGIDVHKRQWHVSIRTQDIAHKTFTQAPHVEALVAYLHRRFPGGDYQCAYEAGFSGFGIAHGFASHGICCLVVHPSDIPRTERDRVYKSDPVDARRLARELAAGRLKSIYIPDQESVESRMLVRMRHVFVRKQTRCKTQIRFMLYLSGIPLPAIVARKSWSHASIDALGSLQLSTPSGTVALQALVAELRHLRAQVASLTKQIQALSKEGPLLGHVQRLRTLPGIGILSAMTLLTEIIDIHRFRTNEKLASYAGLVPGTHSSGEKQRGTGLHKRRNAELRHVLIESAWSAVRQDPVLLAWFTQACRRCTKSQAIVGVARRLLNRVCYVLRTEQPYVCSMDSGSIQVA